MIGRPFSVALLRLYYAPEDKNHTIWFLLFFFQAIYFIAWLFIIFFFEHQIAFDVSTKKKKYLHHASFFIFIWLYECLSKKGKKIRGKLCSVNFFLILLAAYLDLLWAYFKKKSLPKNQSDAFYFVFIFFL